MCQCYNCSTFSLLIRLQSSAQICPHRPLRPHSPVTVVSVGIWGFYSYQCISLSGLLCLDYILLSRSVYRSTYQCSFYFYYNNNNYYYKRERERARARAHVCVCVRERERENIVCSGKNRNRKQFTQVLVIDVVIHSLYAKWNVFIILQDAPCMTDWVKTERISQEKWNYRQNDGWYR